MDLPDIWFPDQHGKTPKQKKAKDREQSASKVTNWLDLALQSKKYTVFLALYQSLCQRISMPAAEKGVD